MKRYEEIKAQITDENPDALFADGFDNALIGVARRCGQPSLAVYDREKCIKILEKRMDRMDAEEYFEYNVSGSWLGPNTPIFIASPFRK